MTTTRNESTIAMLELIVTITQHAEKNIDKRRTDTPEKMLNRYQLAQTVYDLGRIAKRLHKLYEHMCNYGDEKYEKSVDKLEAEATTHAKSIGLVYKPQRDPRGWPMILEIPSINFETRLG